MNRLKRKLFTLFLGAISINSFAQLYPFTSHEFTNSGAEGKDGPTLAMCVSEYSGATWTADAAFFNLTTQGIQQWTVPQNGEYIIECAGAQGGRHAYTVDPEDGGLGAIMEGTFTLTEGQILYILVGQEGIASQEGGGAAEDNAAPGGGGGSFVWDPTDASNPLIAAGGGGAGGSPGDYELRDATVEINGHTGSGIDNAGLGGNGGRTNIGGSSYWGGGGAGWITNGTGGNQAVNYNYLPGTSGAQGGRRAIEGGIGGIRWNDGLDEGGDGGFGGGGGGGSDNMEGGGGGGYSGGGGGRWTVYPGGGGSYNAGADQSNSVGNTGMGYVIISRACNAIAIEASAEEVCFGDEVILSGTSVSGEDVTWDAGVTDGEGFVPPIGLNTYTASTTNDEDCATPITILVNEVPNTFASTTPDNDMSGVGEIDLVVMDGVPGYEYDWSNDGTGDFDDTEDLTGLTNGNYTVVVRDAIGCESQPNSFYVGDLVSIEESESNSIRIYPNPTKADITISAEGNFEYVILSSHGNVVAQGIGFDQEIVSLNEIANGIYLVKLIANDKTDIIKVIKE